MNSIEREYDRYLGTVSEMLAAEGLTDAVSLLRVATSRIEQTGFDNWNGGTSIWTVYLAITPVDYARVGTKRETIEKLVEERFKTVAEQYSTDWFSVKIVPAVENRGNWRDASDVSQVTRQNIIDGLKLEAVQWHGRLNDVEFLGRLFDLETLPSHDHRFKDAAGDIWQHRINNPDDLPDDWVYSDKRLNLLRGPAETFLRFLCEMVHPMVRPDRDEALKLVQQFNDQLRQDGWCLVEQEKIAGRPRFVSVRVNQASERSVSRALSVADALDAGWMQKAIERLENCIESDPELAIGTAKELVESCCKSILSKRGIAVSRSSDLPSLTKALAKELQLVPDGVPEEVKGGETIRLILRNLSSLTQYLAELRGLYGTGHGRDGTPRGLEPRHARLAVGAAVTFIDFVTDTYHRRVERQGVEGESE